MKASRRLSASASALALMFSLAACSSASAPGTSGTAAPASSAGDASGSAAPQSSVSQDGSGGSADAAENLSPEAKLALSNVNSQAEAIAKSATKLYPYPEVDGDNVLPRKNAEVYVSFVSGLKLGTYEVSGKDNKRTLTICVENTQPAASATYEVALGKDSATMKKVSESATSGC